MSKKAILIFLVMLPFLAMGAWYPVNPRNGDMQTDAGGAVRTQQCHVAHFRWASPNTAVVNLVCDITVPATAARVIQDASLTDPDEARNLTMVASSSYNGIVTVTGTNIAGDVIHEHITLSTTATTTGTLAFKRVTEVEVPANEAIRVGTGDKLGLPYMSAYTEILDTYLNDVRESTAATVVRDADEIEKNTLDLNSTLNNTKVDVLFTWY